VLAIFLWNLIPYFSIILKKIQRIAKTRFIELAERFKADALALQGYLGYPQILLKTHAATETSGLLGLLYDPFGGMLQTSSKPMRQLRLRDCWDYFMIPLGGASDELKTHAASPQVFLLPKLAEASFARSDNKKPTIIRGL
jgi:hypothetical protein